LNKSSKEQIEKMHLVSDDEDASNDDDDDNSSSGSEHSVFVRTKAANISHYEDKEEKDLVMMYQKADAPYRKNTSPPQQKW